MLKILTILDDGSRKGPSIPTNEILLYPKSKINFMIMKRIINFSLAAMVCCLVALAFSCKNKGTQETATTDTVMNTLTPEEVAQGWQLLFDGKTFNGWKRYNHDTIGPLWTVHDGLIECNGQGLTEGTANIGGSLMTTRQFGNFELSVDWKISPGGNSGILYHVIEGPEYAHDYETGPEFQLLDDSGWKGDTLKPAQLVGSNYDMYPAPTDKKIKPAGEWNNARLIYNNGHVVQYLNGEKTVDFEEGSADFQKRYVVSKWPHYPGWNKSKTGAISLQDHGAPIFFRNIKIKEL